MFQNDRFIITYHVIYILHTQEWKRIERNNQNYNLRIKFNRRNYVSKSNAISISVLKAYNLKPHNSKVAARGT